ncbi:Trypsin [Actinacidiphila alni]|uniref:Trypsin n=1 Tax=Actinacidiphila alni TaxID=380248 RepID=A0A1I2LQM2_9ACTN|nr:S1 family peptidase [Actinacidiphila alni]SFF81624.1 Trypsin [Actinacidiphila alni]
MSRNRRGRAIRFTAVGAAFAGAAVLAVAGCSTGDSGGGKAAAPAPAAAASASPSGSGSDRTAEAVKAVAKSLGVSEDQARQRLIHQASMVDLNTKVSTALKPEWSAGTWLDSTTGDLTVAVTNEKRAAQMRAAHAVPRIVRYSADDLSAIRARVQQRLEQNSVPSAETYVEAKSNVLVVEAQRSDLPQTVIDELKDEFKDAIDVRLRDQPVESASISGGDRIDNSQAICSDGWWVRNAQSQNFVLTAGHCAFGKSDPTWKADGQTLGQVQTFRRDSEDWALIHVTDDNVARQLSTDIPVSATESLTIASELRSPSDFPPGSIVCKRGVTTGFTCGPIIANGVTQQIDDPATGYVLQGATRVKLVSDHGDSGGAVFAIDPSGATNSVIALGLLSAGSEGNDPATDNMWFQPLKPVLDETGTLLVASPN